MGPFTATADSTALLDGSVQVVAVGRDAAGNITGMSAPVTLTVANLQQTTAELQAPDDVSQTFVDWITWQVHGVDSNGIQAFVYVVDGKATYHVCNCGQDTTDTFYLDTKGLKNGLHWFSVEVVPLDVGHDRVRFGSAGVTRQFRVANPLEAIDLRANFNNLYFHDGQTEPVKLTGNLENISFSSDASAVASVSSDGIVTPGKIQGIANIILTNGDQSRNVRVTNIPGHSGFPHFTRDGRIVYQYDPDNSLWVRTLFNTDMWSGLINTPGFADAFHQGASNALNSGFYENPVHLPVRDFNTYVDTSGALLQQKLAAMAANNFALVGTGDDITGTDAALNFSITNPFEPFGQSVLKYVMGQLASSGLAVSVEMQDEIGCQLGPTCVGAKYRTLMGIVNSFPARPPVSWPGGGASTVAAWVGDKKMSDYNSLYWTFNAGQFRSAFGQAWSLQDLKLSLDQTIAQKIPVMQVDKPSYLETFGNGPGYFKRVAGDRYQPGQDELSTPGFTVESVSAQILYAAALGFAGVRVYGYDGYSATDPGIQNDGQWYYRRANAPADGSNTDLLQAGASPFGVQLEVRDRWTAISNAFNVIQTLEPYLLSPQVNALDLGADITTGARQLESGAGRMFMAVNLLDNTNTITMDLSPYRYQGGSAMRYRVAGLFSASGAVANDAKQTMTLAPGEAVIFVFTPMSSFSSISRISN